MRHDERCYLAAGVAGGVGVGALAGCAGVAMGAAGVVGKYKGPRWPHAASKHADTAKLEIMIRRGKLGRYFTIKILVY